LQRFKTGEHDFETRFHAAMENADQEAAIRHAHSLKSVAGTIGARDLRAVAAALEQGLINGDSTESLLSDVLDRLGPVLQGIGQEEIEKSPPTDEDPASLIEALLDRLKEHDADAVALGDQLAQHPVSSHHPAMISELQRHLAAYDFDRSLDVLNQLQEALDDD